MKEKRYIICASVVMSIVYILVNVTFKFWNRSVDEIAAYILALSYLPTLGCLIVATDEKGVTKKQVGIWAVTSLIPTVTAFVIDVRNRNIPDALFLSISAYGALLMMCLLYRIYKNRTNYTKVIWIGCIVLYFLLPYFYSVVLRMIGIQLGIFSCLEDIILAGIYYLVLKKKDLI